MTAPTLVRRLFPLRLRVGLRSVWARTRASTSQIGQDRWIFGEAFDGMRSGTFVDLGAADGISLSNTFLLEKRFGWNGICIEANPRTFERLRLARDAACVNACVDSGEGSVDFVLRDQLSGIVGPGLDDPTGAEGETVRLPTRSLVSILEEQRVPAEIDYLSVDVEGAEERALGVFPFDAYRFRCMTIERPSAALRDVLAAAGYRVAREFADLDVFYVHDSFAAEYLRNAFRYWERVRRRRAGS